MVHEQLASLFIYFSGSAPKGQETQPIDGFDSKWLEICTRIKQGCPSWVKTK